MEKFNVYGPISIPNYIFYASCLYTKKILEGKFFEISDILFRWCIELLIFKNKIMSYFDLIGNMDLIVLIDPLRVYINWILLSELNVFLDKRSAIDVNHPFVLRLH